MPRNPSRIAPGDSVDVRQVDTVSSGPVTLPDPQRLTHLQFRRYAGCPICNLHLRSFGQRHDELEAAGVREIAVFHSTTGAMTPYQDTLPFVLIADPQRKLYREFGVERSLRSIADPRAWAAAAPCRRAPRRPPMAARRAARRAATAATRGRCSTGCR